jgi:hypothetical protein
MIITRVCNRRVNERYLTRAQIYVCLRCALTISNRRKAESPRASTKRQAKQLIPAPPTLRYNPLAHHPNGAAVRRYARGWVRVGACGRELRPAPGRLRGTALGTLRSLCEELARKEAGGTGLRPRARQGDEPHWRLRPRAREPGFREARPGVLKNAEGGAPRGVRMVAQFIRAASWLNGRGSIPRASRRSASPVFF